MVVMLVVAAAGACLGGLSHPPQRSVPADLRSRATHFEGCAIKRDLRGLLKLCASRVELIEVYRLTPKELRFGAGTFFDVRMPEASNHVGYQVRREVMDTRSLDSFHRQLALSFCGYVADSAKVPGFIQVVDDRLEEEEDLVPFEGRGLSGKIASNALWRVDFELRRGRWLATRFVVAER